MLFRNLITAECMRGSSYDWNYARIVKRGKFGRFGFLMRYANTFDPNHGPVN